VEAKMNSVRERQKLLVQRHVHAQTKRRAEESIRRADGSDVMVRVEGFERRIDRMEAEADLVNYGRKPTLSEEFERLVGDEELEKELEELKAKVKSKGQ
jgi:phage shock protein A